MKVPSPTEYLDDLGVDYQLIPHFTSFTAQETAQKTHIKGNRLSKVVIVGDDTRLSMIVIPANCIIQQKQLGRVLRSHDLHLVPEQQFQNQFPRCETGAMPPFGNLYGMSVFVAMELLQANSITFNGGTHNILINMDVDDFLSLTGARKITKGYKVAGTIHPVISKKKDDWHWV